MEITIEEVTHCDTMNIDSNDIITPLELRKCVLLGSRNTVFYIQRHFGL